MKNNLQKNRSEKGQSLVELGFSMMVLMLILAGVIELGMLLFQYVAMRDAAEEGAAYVSLYPSGNGCNQTIERVKKNLYNVDPAQVQVDVLVHGTACLDTAPQFACAGQEATVIVSQPNYRITMPFLGSALGRQSLNIQAKVTSTIIRPACPTP